MVPEGKIKLVAHSSKGAGESGIDINVLCVDEVHELTDRDMLNRYLQAHKSDPQSLTIMTTNTGRGTNNIGWEMRKRAQDVLEGKVINETLLAMIYCIDPEDIDLVTEVDDDGNYPHKHLWLKANPSLPSIPSPEYIPREIERGRTSPFWAAEVRRFQFGVWGESAEPWIAQEFWEACEVSDSEFELEPWKKGSDESVRTYLGFDLAVRRDFCAPSSIHV